MSECTQCRQGGARFRCEGCVRPFCGDACHEKHRCIDNHYCVGSGAPYVDHIESRTLQNSVQFVPVYQEEPSTGGRLQVAVMSVRDEVPRETHAHVTQFIRVESGRGRLETDQGTWALGPGEAAVIGAGVAHRIVNEGAEPLKLYTIYAKDSSAPEWKH
jgi:mannose-6-phosphate isomerase-like protein (cupin superfamily)